MNLCCPIISELYLKEPRYLSLQIATVFKDCGIEVRGKDSEGKEFTLVGFHSLRHTFVSECAKAGAPASVVQALVGHGNPAMTRHYTHIDLETTAKAMQAIEGGRVEVIEDGEVQELAHSVKEELRMLIEAITSENYLEVKQVMLQML